MSFRGNGLLSGMTNNFTFHIKVARNYNAAARFFNVEVLLTRLLPLADSLSDDLGPGHGRRGERRPAYVIV